MSEKQAVDRYYACLKKLEVAEVQHRAALDELSLAAKAGIASKVTGLRLAAKASESALCGALQAATSAHRSYWLGRQESMLPQLSEAVDLIHRFNRVAAAAGSNSHRPGLAIISKFLDGKAPVDVVSEVPFEGPDCELLEERKGCWISGRLR